MGSICTAMNPVLWTGAPERAAVKRQPMDQAPDCLDRDRRAAVLDALCEVCFDRGGISGRRMCEPITCMWSWKQAYVPRKS